MTISRAALGSAVRAARDAADLSIRDLASRAGLSAAVLSRTENGERDLAYTELLAIAQAVGLRVEDLHNLAENCERQGVGRVRQELSQLQADLLQLQRAALLAAIEARASLSE